MFISSLAPAPWTQNSIKFACAPTLFFPEPSASSSSRLCTSLNGQCTLSGAQVASLGKYHLTSRFTLFWKYVHCPPHLTSPPSHPNLSDHAVDTVITSPGLFCLSSCLPRFLSHPFPRHNVLLKHKPEHSPPVMPLICPNPTWLSPHCFCTCLECWSYPTHYLSCLTPDLSWPTMLQP